jgi:hypothetical protein
MPTKKIVIDVQYDFYEVFIVECDEDGSIVLESQATAETITAIKYCDAVDKGLVKASDEGLRFVRHVAGISIQSLLKQCRAEIEKTNKISDGLLSALGISNI